MGPLVLVVASLLVVLGAICWTKLLRPDSSFDAVVTVGVVATATIVLTLEAAGLAGALRRGPVVLLAALLGLPAVVLARPWTWAPSLRRRWDPVLSDWWTMALVALAALALLWQSVVALTLPPYAYDAITYHLSTVAIWIQRGDLARSPLSNCCSHYPFTSDLSFAWPMLLTGDDSLVNTVQLGYAVLGAAAVAGIARSLGLAGRMAVAAGALFVVTPIVLTQAPTEFVDLMLAAWVLAALHALLRFALTADPRRLVVAGLATAMVLGTKGTGVLWAATLAVGMLAVSIVLARRRQLSPGAAATGLGAVVVACLALSSFWYVRNWIDEGNPIHPFRLEVAGAVVFDGPADLGAIDEDATPHGDAWPIAVVRSWATDLDFWHVDGVDYQQRLGGLGPVWAWLGIPLLLVGGVIALRRRHLATLPLLLVGIVFVLQPYRWWSRFTIPLAAAGAVAVAAAAGAAPWRSVRSVLRGAALALAVAGVALVSVKVEPGGRAEALTAWEVLQQVGDDASLGELFHHEYEFLDGVPARATVVVDLPADPVRFVYPLFGPDLDRRVIRLEADTPLDGRWVVTGRGRPVDRRLQREGRHELVADRRDLRAWRPVR